MATAFTVPPVRFPGSHWLFLLFLAACSSPAHQTGMVSLNREDSRLRLVNDIVFLADKPFTGTAFSLFPATADTAERAGYREGRQHGIWKQYYPGGNLREQRVYNRGQKMGEYVAWWPNGQQQLQYQFSQDEYEGTCREWNEKGVLIQEMNYHKGHEEGTQKLFYNDGKVRANYTIIDGRRYGLLGTKNCVNVSDSVFRQ
ncbi:MAG: toxin-antitoxin system YwqK family antitoxin [Spirosoma sp.]|nr:toxin-antitoxin system YwqK family antitoxin [Spirosoma sp.]